ncbi:MAG: 2-dehydropantoate 2-reductase [Candidatus Omnitrophota bacterium]
MKTAVIGAGAIGGLTAGYLANAGEDVTLIARPNQAAVIARDGLTIEGARGKISVRLPVKARLDEDAHLVILAVKTQDVEQVILDNINYLRQAFILTTQNGVRAERIVTAKLDSKQVFPSIVMFGATCLSPGKITHNFEGNWILGDNPASAAGSLERIRQVTSRAFPSPVSEEVMGMKWLKLFINANNCLPAILGKSMQETFKNTSICKISLRLWAEGWDIVNKAKIQISSLPDFPKERLSGLLAMPLEQAAVIYSGIMTNLSKEPLYGSILQSIKRGRPSEIDYINGEFVTLARGAGRRAPLNEKLVRMVHNVEKSGQFLSEDELLNQTETLL